MKQEQITYQQVFRTFGLQPEYESPFCLLFEDCGRHFCLYHEKESLHVQCLYLNALKHISAGELLSLLSPWGDLRLVSLDAAGPEYTFMEKTFQERMVKWCYSIKQINPDGDLPDAARAFITHFDTSKDIYVDENHQLKLILRHKSGEIADILQYRDDGFQPAFSSFFGSWDYRPDTSSLLHPLYTTNPYLIPPFFEENNPYHYHTHVVSGYHYPEFTQMFMQIVSDEDHSLAPSFFLLSCLKEYMDLIGFLCHYATIISKKNFFNHFRYTDHIVLEIVPFDSPLGHFGLTFKSWQTLFSQKIGEQINISKWQTGSGIYTGLPKKIDILHQLCIDFIHLNKLSIRLINHVLDADAGDREEPINEPYDEQIF